MHANVNSQHSSKYKIRKGPGHGVISLYIVQSMQKFDKKFYHALYRDF